MRYKFRGQRVDTKEWIEGSLIQLNSGLCYITKNIHGLHLPLDGKLMCEFTHEVIPESVGMWTGLLDKEGKEIYEGDIVYNQHDEQGKYTVEWDTENACFVFGEDKLLCKFRFHEFWEVIGTIHTHPELLESSNG